ncbi:MULTISPECIES: pyocin activator PrtN family protein [Vibrio]|uniref:pyocin activator PrtN family protein n=1 Tax=Vibrio TaxID=662 RepID=UPI000C86D6FF|nr:MULTISPECIES: pyocin activator PrtN family protein [Vibrio]EIA1496860.1 pyocin activator PrtN family protein [Vibrio parahaemolyticus]ELA7322939.1 pyocin activator PrtN family protein [Vibrio parahaemolyticus]MBE3994902.1 hypothetical protein [Vibrio parahaemolyticus]MBT0110053.1 pyocin activator PrtN family protein [Vibrio alginolyticus]MBY7899118.1 pyocin activator PrtN family protein [Vibrio fluvialis]
MMNVPFSNPTTATLLAAKFQNQPLISLVDVAGEYLGLTPSTAKRKARVNDLPFPVLRLSDSQKAPWLVKFEHFVEYVERTAANSHSDWLRMQC